MTAIFKPKMTHKEYIEAMGKLELIADKVKEQVEAQVKKDMQTIKNKMDKDPNYRRNFNR